MPGGTELRAHRGAILHFRAEPGVHSDPTSFEFLDDGLLVIAGGRISAVGPAPQLLPGLPQDTEVIPHGTSILIPGFRPWPIR